MFSTLAILVQLFFFCSQYEVLHSHPLLGSDTVDAQGRLFKSVVAIVNVYSDYYGAHYDHDCSGVLISVNQVLTAAHCLTHSSVQTLKIVIGTRVLRNNAQYHNVSWWMTYNEWAELENDEHDFEENDVAIIRLEKEIPNGVYPALISSRANNDLQTVRLTLVGWTDTNNEIMEKNLKTTRANVLNSNACKLKAVSLQDDVEQFEERFLCTSSNPSALLETGDSGGPVFYNNKIVGINVGICPTGNGVNPNEQVNFHVGIDYFRNFIEHLKYEL